MDDDFRGRVFAFYDMLFNVPFVLGAAVARAFMPVNGKSYLLLAVAAAGLRAGGRGLLGCSAVSDSGGRIRRRPGGSRPSAAAQRRSS